MRYFWQLRTYFRPVARQLLAGSICGILANTLVVLPAVLLGYQIDIVLGSNKMANLADVAGTVLVFLGGVCLALLPRLGMNRWLLTANARMLLNIRVDALRGALGRPAKNLDHISSGDLMARIMADGEVLGAGLREFSVEIWDTLLFCISGGVVMMWLYDLRYAFAALPMLTLYVVVGALINLENESKMRAQVKAAREADAERSNLLQEYLSGIRTFKFLGRTGALTQRVAGQSLAASDPVEVRPIQVISAFLLVGVMSVITLAYAGPVLFGIKMHLSVGKATAFLLLFLQFSRHMYRVPQVFNRIRSGSVAYDRLKPLLISTPEKAKEVAPQPATAAVVGAPHPLAVSLKGVTLRYPGAGQPALQEVSLDVPPGAWIGITGPVGSGKSAVLRAILGLYPLEAGEVQLEGHPLVETSAVVRATQIGYVPQEPFLFSGSAGENIGMGLEVAPEWVARSAAIAQVEFDLQTPVNGLGPQASGQIALARGLTTSMFPGLLLLDDPFSAVDLETEAKLIRALRQAFGPEAPPDQRATLLLSSPRLAAFPQMDQVVVLDHGRVIETGNHAELISTGGLYARIFRAQTLIAHKNGGA